MQERRKWQPPQKESEDFRVYTNREETESYNKKDHSERSKYHQPNHNKWWKKREKKTKLTDED